MRDDGGWTPEVRKRPKNPQIQLFLLRRSQIWRYQNNWVFLSCLRLYYGVGFRKTCVICWGGDLQEEISSLFWWHYYGPQRLKPKWARSEKYPSVPKTSARSEAAMLAVWWWFWCGWLFQTWGCMWWQKKITEHTRDATSANDQRKHATPAMWRGGQRELFRHSETVSGTFSLCFGNSSVACKPFPFSGCPVVGEVKKVGKSRSF